MQRWIICLCSATFVLAAFAADAPKEAQPAGTAPKVRQIEPRSQNAGWIAALARLRTAPQAGEIINGGVTANLADILDIPAAEKAKAAEVQNACTAALIAKAAKWNEELAALRAEYDAQLVAQLPENKREAAAKVIALSRANWASELDFENKLTSEFLEHRKKLQAAPNPEDQKEIRMGNVQWFTQQRLQRQQMQQEIVAKLKALLTPAEAERLDACDRYRTVAQPEKK